MDNIPKIMLNIPIVRGSLDEFMSLNMIEE
jgi:hypothetical protein